LHDLFTVSRLDDATLDASYVISWNRALVHQCAYLMPTVSEQLNCSTPDLP